LRGSTDGTFKVPENEKTRRVFEVREKGEAQRERFKRRTNLELQRGCGKGSRTRDKKTSLYTKER